MMAEMTIDEALKEAADAVGSMLKNVNPTHEGTQAVIITLCNLTILSIKQQRRIEKALDRIADDTSRIKRSVI